MKQDPDLFALEWFDDDGSILVPANCQLTDRLSYIELAWQPARREAPRLGGRKNWPRALELNAIYTTRLYFPDGSRYQTPDVYAIFPDPDNRWMTNFLRADRTGEAPASPSKLFERVRMISVYCILRALQRLKQIR